MTLEELKALWDAAEAEAKAKPEDKVLKAAAATAKKAYDDKLAEAEEEDDEDEPVEPDESKLDPKTKAYIAKLRKENAGHRTKAKDLASKLKFSDAQKKAILKAAGIDSEDESPEEQIKSLTAETQTQAFRNAVLENAVVHGVGKDELKYFQYLVADAAGTLEEGEELSEEQIAEIAKEAKKKGSKKGNTTVGGGKGDAPPPGGGKEVTLDQFCRMSIVEKSKLYETNKDLYTDLMQQARAKKKLV